MTKTKTFIISLLLLSLTAQAQTPKAYFGTTPPLKVSGKEIVDPNGKAVTLHGVMDTPSPYFNNYRWTGGQWADIGHNGDNYVDACKNYFDKIFTAITDTEQGAFCNLFRLHLDPCWTNDPNKTATNGGGENDISRFSETRLRKYLESLYIPIAENAIKHGLYVIIRPPGVFPADVSVGDTYNTYLKTVWDIVSSNETVKKYSGQISLELGNEPVRMTGSLADYFQPIVNKIRENGFEGIIWLPGLTWQQNYTSYTTNPITDDLNNYGYAVHCYPSWFSDGNGVSNDTFIESFENLVPVVNIYPIVITEVDWSPMKQGAGHMNEAGTQYVEGNFGTWGTGTTDDDPKYTTDAANVSYKNTQCKGFGNRFKALTDKHTNISWTLQGTTTYVNMDKYLANGTVEPAFLDEMVSAGYNDAYQACSATCMEWYREYACGDRLPTEKVYQTIENTKFVPKDDRYYFYKNYSSAFEFETLKGVEVEKIAEFTIHTDKNNSSVGYRLDFSLTDANGNDITIPINNDANNIWVIGSEEKGTRSERAIGTTTYNIQTLLADYIKIYPGCKFNRIRINTTAPGATSEDIYYITMTGFSYLSSEIEAIANDSKTTNIKSNPFCKWNIDNGTVIKKANNNCYNIGTEIAEGGEILGYELLGNVSSDEYIDLTGQDQMIIEGIGGTLRILYNRDWEHTALTKEMFCTWDNYNANANATDTGIGSYAFGQSTGLPYGDGNVSGNNYADLTEWKYLDLTVTAGIPRLIFNRQGMSNSGSYTEIKSTESEYVESIKGNVWTINLEKIKNSVTGQDDYVHLNCIKGANWQDCTITKAKLRKRPGTNDALQEKRLSLEDGIATFDISEIGVMHLHSIKVLAEWQGGNGPATVNDIFLCNKGWNMANYSLTGAGNKKDSASNLLEKNTDVTVIDITAMVNTLPQKLESVNPNCLFIQSKAQYDANLFEGTPNLITKNSNNYSTTAITLEDGHAFRAPVDITTDNATYSRTLTTQWGTATLPFSFTVTNTTPQVFRLKDVSDGKMTFKRIPVNETIPANTPILYYNPSIGETTFSGQDIKKTIDGWNAQPIIKEDNSTVNGWYVCQSMIDKVIEDVATDNFFKDYDVYVINKDNFILATKKLTSKTFRAFFLHRKDGTGNAPATSFSIAIEDDINGISDASVDKHAVVTERYDASGRRINTPVRGVNIIRMSDGSVRKVLK